VAYRDPTEPLPEADVPPAWCPRCRGPLITKWKGHRHYSRHDPGYTAVAYPFFVCSKCEIAVKVVRLPNGKYLRNTKRSARDDVHREQKAFRRRRKS
jgi:hypothetical protein